MILHVNRRIRELKASNVVSILADPDDPLLPEGSADCFFFSDSWLHIENQTKYLSLMKQMLKPGGEIIMIDFHKKELPFRAADANENRPRGSDQADGEQGISANERAHLPALPVFPGLCRKVDHHGILYSTQFLALAQTQSGQRKFPRMGIDATSTTASRISANDPRSVSK
jgi:SAM-dependent methyltransferase